jgi:hypothetical protein
MVQGLNPVRGKTFIFSPKCLHQGFFLLAKPQGCAVDCSIPLALRLRMGGAVHMLLLFVFMIWTGTVLL